MINEMIGYLWQVLRHKWFVFLECCKLGIPWLGIIHDLSKFRLSEFISYAKYFRGGKSPNDEKHDIDFDYAWLHHQRRNKHHWQYWILMNDNPKPVCWMIQEHSMGNPPILAFCGKPLLLCELESGQDDAIHTTANTILRDVCGQLNKLQPLPMPGRYRREMLADWRGAGRAYGNPDTRRWYEQNKNRIVLHDDTREWIERQINLTYDYDIYGKLGA